MIAFATYSSNNIHVQHLMLSYLPSLLLFFMYLFSQVKTTNPKKYCVRPNTGVVLPGTTCDVTGAPLVIRYKNSACSCASSLLSLFVVCDALLF